MDFKLTSFSTVLLLNRTIILKYLYSFIISEKQVVYSFWVKVKTFADIFSPDTGII